MKKSFTRVLSLVLVLVMMLGVLPMASAEPSEPVVGKPDPSVELPETATATWNEAKTAATVSLNGTVADAHGYTETSTWTVTGDATYASTGTNNAPAATFTFTSAGTYTVKLTTTYAKNEFADEDEDAPETLTPASATCTVTVPESGLVTATAAPVTVNVGTSASIAVTYNPALTSAPAASAYSYESDDTTVATVDASGKVTGVKVGTTKVSITLPAIDDVTFSTNTIECTVAVTSGTITAKSVEKEASTTQATETLTPSFSGGGNYDTDDVNFKFTALSSRGTISVHETTGVITYTGPSAILVKVEAYDKTETTKKVGETTVTASFYVYNQIEVTMKDSATEMLLGTASDIKESGSLLSNMLANYSEVKSDSDRIYFSGLNSNEGTFSGTNYVATEKRTTVSGASLVKFTVGTAGTATFSYSIVPTEIGVDAVLCKGYVTLKYDGALADIAYSTTYNKSVTFDESDFYKFWASANKTSALDYVTFSIGTLYPAYGTLYTSTTSTATAYKATASHKFYYGSFTSGTNNKDLGSLTYVPNSTKTNTYDVTIPFTAYGTTASETVSGTVVIHMNPNDNNISSRGIFFGTVYDNKGTTTTTDDLTYADQLAEIYYNATGKELGFVVFTLPAAEKATLYSKLPTSGGNTLVAQGTRLSSNVKVYYKSTSSLAADLGNVALVPAAGFSGALTVSFTGYDAAGNNEKTCSITFNVTTKTASSIFSDVTAKGYSWAADSVDFLYYEGTAQGSNGKYNPAAYITRQDFMLMLYRAFLEEDYGTYNVSSNFPDVVKGSTTYSKEIYQAVGVAKYLGIAQGTNNKFNPTSNITRQEAMVLIYRTLEVIGKDLRTSSSVKATSFKDYSKIGSWATTAIGNLVSHGVIQGTNDYINPLSNITRAEMACILHRVITY